MASETDDGDDCIADILAASDELSRVIDRYKFVVLRGRTDSVKRDTTLANTIPTQGILRETNRYSHLKPKHRIPAPKTISKPLQRKNSEELLDLGGGGGQE